MLSSDYGKKAELMVAGYLRSKGCIISKMNYHSRYGEIDIIAENEKNLIFTEVKMRAVNSMVLPAEAVDINKQRRIILTAKDYISKTDVLALQPRFDVAEVYYENLPGGNKKYKIHYIKNAFQAI